MNKSSGNILVLAGILLLALTIRLIGPFRDMALGQTDAYSHLQFLKDWLADGRLRHPYYPPGYYWVIGWPSQWLGWDPYLVIRFGGAFFGAGLVLSSYALARYVWSSSAGLWTALFVAIFPAFHWLQKTGVGAYPSQLGLLLIPVIVLSWDAILRGRFSQLLLFVPSVLLLAVSVPMMGIDLLPFVMLDLVVRMVCDDHARRARMVFLLWLAVAGAAAIALLWSGAAESVARIATTVASHSYDVETAPTSVLFHILWSYLAPIRWWPGHVAVSLSAYAVGVALIGLLFMCWRKGSAVRMVALWAVFAWLQTVFGFAQFPPYWRAGWVLLLAMAVLGGWLVPHLLERLPRRGRHLAYGIVALLSALSFVYPPVHQPHLSAAENDLVTVLRELERWPADSSSQGVGRWFPESLEPPQLLVWARAYTLFDQNQGAPVHAFLAGHEQISVRTVPPQGDPLIRFDRGLSHLILLDDQAPPRETYGMMENVNPELVQSFKTSYSHMLEGGIRLRDHVTQMEATGDWIIRRVILEEGLEVILAEAVVDLSD